MQRPRGEVLSSCLRIDSRCRQYHAHLDGDTYLVFCFSAREAASEFQTRWNVDTDEVSKRGHWEPREGNVCNLYGMLSNQEAIRSITRR